MGRIKTCREQDGGELGVLCDNERLTQIEQRGCVWECCGKMVDRQGGAGTGLGAPGQEVCITAS